MARFKLSNLVILGLVAYVAYSQRDKLKSLMETKDAEYTHYDVDGVRVQDYGSLENPKVLVEMGQGQAPMQYGSQANEAQLAMIVSGVGQNYNGRSLGF